MPQDLTQLTQITGVGVAGLSVFLMYKLFSNHLTPLTEAINKLIIMIERLEGWLEKHKNGGV